MEILDARYCVSCHTEHQQEQTRAMGVTLPDDYCYHCHKDIGEDRDSHKNLAFDSCASAGCHNYHDNRALYEEFLVGNAMGQWLKTLPAIDQPQGAGGELPEGFHHLPGFEEKHGQHADIHEQWLASAHGQADIHCGGCHSSESGDWLAKPGMASCQNCHAAEAEGFLQGKHGMRLAQGLEAITPGAARLSFNSDKQAEPHSCLACHGAHRFDTQYAATSACLNCHQDEHSTAFNDSPHGQLAIAVATGELPAEQGVTCATCHLPRVPVSEQNKDVLRVEHNQNMNLRPNEKMIRPVCMQCHSLGFSIDALADEALIKNNFSGRPTEHVPSIDWALKRETTQ
ncbi:MAG TPA: hypothetical protein DCF62_13910 [Porticoccaceae bacterium]|nr:hypothetical protein [Porticoccaceae bacterium]